VGILVAIFPRLARGVKESRELIGDFVHGCEQILSCLLAASRRAMVL
jgi:hypothetical protein